MRSAIRTTTIAAPPLHPVFPALQADCRFHPAPVSAFFLDYRPYGDDLPSTLCPLAIPWQSRLRKQHIVVPSLWPSPCDERPERPPYHIPYSLEGALTLTPAPTLRTLADTANKESSSHLARHHRKPDQAPTIPRMIFGVVTPNTESCHAVATSAQTRASSKQVGFRNLF